MIPYSGSQEETWQTSQILDLALAVAAFAGVALAQSADKNTGGPTANTLQLRLTEPAEAPRSPGRKFRVGVAYNMQGFGQGQGTKFGEANFPQRPSTSSSTNDLKATLKGNEANVAFIENVPPRCHKIVVWPKNVSGEVIDRTGSRDQDSPGRRRDGRDDHEDLRRAAEPAPAPAPPPAPEPVIEAPAPPPAPVVSPSSRDR